MARLSTHVLDTHSGRPASGMVLRLEHNTATGWETILQTKTNADGRTDEPLLQIESLIVGTYRLTFNVGDYFREQGLVLTEPAFLEQVPVEFGLANETGNYHVPLLCTPWSYSTYRGS